MNEIDAREDSRRSRARYAVLKKSVENYETTNFSTLMLFKSGKDWYKMAGNSLLIYKYKIAPLAGHRINVLPDNDYTDVIFDEGIVSFRNIDALKERLEKTNVYKSTLVGRETIRFGLNFVIEPEEIAELKRQLVNDQEKAASLLKPEIVMMPQAYTKMRHVMKRTYELTRKMNIIDRDCGGRKMMGHAKDMVETYLLMNKNIVPEKEGWEKLLELAEKLQTEIVIGVELKYITQKSAISVGEELISLKRTLKNRIKKFNDPKN